MRIVLAFVFALSAVGCSKSQPDKPATEKLGDTALMHGQLQKPKDGTIHNESAPPGSHLAYFGGRVVSNAQVVQVLYGTGSYIPQVTSTASPSMATFYQGVLNSAHVDWLTEYNTTGLPAPSSNQVIGRGSFSTQVTITPAPENNGSTITDVQIQAELSAQLAAGTLPAPTHDAQGNNNTYYAIFFPHGKVITLGGSGSCSSFCAYHGTIANAGGAGEIYYGVHPDFQAGSGCENGCGAAATQFGNYTQVASHELIETMTDAEVGLATVFGPPLAWYDQGLNQEIGDLCNDQNGHVVGSDGVTYDVQTEFSNAMNDCITVNPNITAMTIDASEETCRGTTATAKVTLFGGGGRFASDVTLSLVNVSPAPPAGGEITATFDPNPVPTPSPAGSISTMRIATTASTPAGTYTLTVQGASTGLTATATTTFVVRTAVPTAPTLVSPANGTDGASSTPTFSWSAASQATSYTLEVLAGIDCTGTPIRSYATSATSFTVPAADALPTFQSFSWRVSGANACGVAATSACFTFRTASCSDPHEALTNGGFESGLQGWTVDGSIPAPLVSGDKVHSGSSAVLLGNLSGPPEPLGDSAFSQVITVPSGSAKLSFWEWPLSTDVVTFDQQYVRVTPISPAGATVVLLNEARNDQAYVRREFDMSQFAGMTVKLTFGVHQDGFGDVTAMYIDDVSVAAQSCGPPEFVVHVTPSGSDEICAGNSITFAVAVDSVNGPNFTSQVTLGTTNLPPGTTATFAKNPIGPGESTTLTLQTTRPTIGNLYVFNVTGVAVTPPPGGVHTTATPVTIDANAPNAPELVSPKVGEVNVPRKPTLSWTVPFVPDSAIAPARLSKALGAEPDRALFLWEMAATRAPKHLRQVTSHAGTAAVGKAAGGGQNPVPYMFGASAYHVQVARDAAFTNIVVDAQVTGESFTVPTDLDIATEYFWRVTASNACGTSAFSKVGSFIVGACSEGWTQAAPIPLTGGPSQSTVIASSSNNKIYVIGGGIGAGPNTRIDQVWAYDPQGGTWTHKTDVPAPGVGANFGSAAELNGKIYVFGGVNGPPGPIVVHRVLWKYDIAGDSWSRGADLPTDNFGAAVAAIGGKIYIAYGSGFATQTWQYDPATNAYTRKADAPVVPATNRLHGVALNGELHAFGGGFEGSAHVIYNPATDSWRVGPSMPFTATDPAVGVLGGKAFVVGGRPVAHSQIFDPATNSWSQGTAITGGIDNTAGAALGLTFHLVGGYDGTNGVNTHWQLHACNVGGLSSAAFLPFVVDGDGKVAGIGNERSSLLLDNAVSGGPLSVSCFLYGTNGSLLGHDTISVAPNEVKTVTDVVRALSHTTTVQNKIGSVALFGTEVFQGMASVVNNVTADSALEDGQSLSGSTGGFAPTIGSSNYLTQTVFSNVSSGSALVQLAAYPPEGGDSPVAASVSVVPAHGIVSTVDVVKSLGLPATFSGQLSWSSNKPVAALVRNVTKNKQYSGIEPTRTKGEAASTVLVPYVEDSAAFSTALELSNPGAITANVTVKFVEVDDTTGMTSGFVAARDLPVSINSGAPIADVVRWALRSTATTPSGKHGFVVVTTPQGVTAQARIVDTVSLDPAVPESNATVTNGFSPVLVRVDPFAFAVVNPDSTAAAAATPQTSQSRFALSNPGSTTATVTLTPYNATGSVALGQPFVVTLAPNGQFFSENLAADMGLPPVFFGAVSIQSSAPVLIYNHRRAGQGGSPVPVH